MSTLFYVLLILAPAAILATAYAIIKKRTNKTKKRELYGFQKINFSTSIQLILIININKFFRAKQDVLSRF